MGQGVGVEFGHRSSSLFHDVVGGSQTLRHGCAGKVGHGQEQLGHFRLAFLETVLQSFGLPLDGSHALLGLLGEVFLAKPSYGRRWRQRVFELGGSAVAFLLKATALGVDFKNLGYDGFAVESFYGKASDNEVGIRLYSLKCKHLNKLLARLCGRRGFCFCFVVLYGYFYPALPGEVRMGRGNGDMREASCKEFLHLC